MYTTAKVKKQILKNINFEITLYIALQYFYLIKITKQPSDINPDNN